MKKHREAVHLGMRYPCVSCEYQATGKSSLKRHQKTIHEGKKVIRTEVFDKDRFYAEVVAEFEKEQRSLVTTLIGETIISLKRPKYGEVFITMDINRSKC